MTIKDVRLDNVGLKLFLLFLFLCPIFYDTQKVFHLTSLRINQEQFFQLGACVLFAVVILENIYLSAFLMWSVCLYAYYGFPPIGGPIVINIFWGCMIYQVSHKLITSDNIEKVFKAILWLAVANIVWLSLQFLNIDLIFMRDKAYNADLVGLMGLKCFMGMFFAICIPILAYFSWPLATLLFIPIYFSESSVAVVGGAIGLLFVVFYHSKKSFITLLAIFALAGSLYVANDTKAGMFDGRFKMWKVVLRDAFKHPVMGWGLDSFRNMGTFKPFLYLQNATTRETKAISSETLKLYTELGVFPPMPEFIQQGQVLDAWDNPHNEYIQLFYEFGSVGILIFLLFCLDVAQLFAPTAELTTLLAVFLVYLIISTGQFPFHVVRLGYLFPVLLGAYYKINEENKGDLSYGT